MKDRVPLYPGRVQLTPVTGQTNVYDMTRADEPTEVGTPLSKASLLSDATAAKLGLSVSATPNDALSVLANLVVMAGSYTGTGTYGEGNPTVLKDGDTAVDFTGITPQLLFIHAARTSPTPVFCAVATGQIDIGISNIFNVLSISNGVVSWYINNVSVDAATRQLNADGAVYHWLVIGTRA